MIIAKPLTKLHVKPTLVKLYRLFQHKETRAYFFFSIKENNNIYCNTLDFFDDRVLTVMQTHFVSSKPLKGAPDDHNIHLYDHPNAEHSCSMIESKNIVYKYKGEAFDLIQPFIRKKELEDKENSYQ